MIRKLAILSAVAMATVVPGPTAQADDGNVIRYPRVYGPTGTPYGPGRAFEEYERRYGRPWHGYGGETAVRQPSGYSGYSWGVTGNPLGPYYYGGGVVNGLGWGVTGGVYGGYSYGYPGYGYSSGSFGPSYIPAAPMVIQAHPQFLGANPFDNSVINKSLQEEVDRWEREVQIDPKQKFVERVVTPSTVQAQLKSLRATAEGNEFFRQQKFAQAYERYRYAASVAEDLPEPRHRMGLAMVAMGKFESASYQFQRALFLDEQWPANGPTLAKTFGEDNNLARVALVHRVADWVRQDIRDPERLFVLGVILHFDRDPRAEEVFTVAYRLAGQGPHLMAFLRYYADNEPLAELKPNPPVPDDAPPIPPAPAPAAPQVEDDQAAPPAGPEQPALPPLPALPAP